MGMYCRWLPDQSKGKVLDSALRFCQYRFLQLFAGHTEGGVVGAGMDASRGSADAAALIASRCLLSNDRNLEIPLGSETCFLPIHRNVSIGTIARALTTADAMVLDDNFL